MSECARELTQEEHETGVVACECGKFAIILKSSILEKLPADYHGELCTECQLWVCSIQKLKEAGFTVKAEKEKQNDFRGNH
jgi:hypothetical protein